MPAERRPDPIQPDPSPLVEAALLVGYASSTRHHPLIGEYAARRAVALVGSEVVLDLIDRCRVQLLALSADLDVELPR